MGQVSSFFGKFVRALCAAALLCLAGCARPAPAQTEFVLGTRCQANLFEDGTPARYRAVFGLLREIENTFSVNLPDSEISAINAAAGREAVPATPAVIELAEAARRYAALSDGAFDPTVGPLVRLWGIGAGDSARLPSGDEIDRALALCGWRDLAVDREAGTVFLRRGGMALDLGGIAKGYAADEAARLLAESGVRRAVIDLGGNIYLLGEKRDRSPWRVGIQNPLESRGSALGVLECSGGVSVVTSGIYERFAEVEGRRYHHILSTETGFPVENGLVSVVILARTSLEADALSTAVFALGFEKGAALLESLRAGDSGGLPQAIFMFDDRTIALTPGLEARFRLESADWRLR